MLLLLKSTEQAQSQAKHEETEDPTGSFSAAQSPPGHRHVVQPQRTMVDLELLKEMWLGEPQVIVQKMITRGLGLQKGLKEHGGAIP